MRIFDKTLEHRRSIRYGQNLFGTGRNTGRGLLVRAHVTFAGLVHAGHGLDAAIGATHVAQPAANAGFHIQGDNAIRRLCQGAGGANINTIAVGALVAGHNCAVIFFRQRNTLYQGQFGKSAASGAGVKADLAISRAIFAVY
jgi:hypothetical protein